MRKVHHDELHHINGGLLPVAMVPLLALAFGLGLGTGIIIRQESCPSDTPMMTPRSN